MPDTFFTLPSVPASEALAEHAAGSLSLVDLRKPEAVARSGQRVAGALVRDPFAFGHDDPLTGASTPLAVFCVAGHEVSQFGCALLMLHGRDVRFVAGGFEALLAAGAATFPAEAGA